MKTAIFNITCRDRKGLVAGVTDFIFRHNGNIIELDQYTDHTARMFFMRLEWDLRGFQIPREDLPHVLGELAVKNGYARSWELFYSDVKPRMAIFVSKFPHCLYDLLLRHQSGELNCEIPLIVSNHQDLKHIADAFKIDFKCIPVTKKNKFKAEEKQLGLLKDYRIDFIVLARYMQILSEHFVNAYWSKIINVHHSFLPAFKGAKAYHQAYERGVKVIGATSHFVTTELDYGPIIKQMVENISHRDSVNDLITKGKDLERIVLAEAARLFIEHRLFISKNRTVTL